MFHERLAPPNEELVQYRQLELTLRGFTSNRNQQGIDFGRTPLSVCKETLPTGHAYEVQFHRYLTGSDLFALSLYSSFTGPQNRNQFARAIRNSDDIKESAFVHHYLRELQSVMVKQYWNILPWRSWHDERAIPHRLERLDDRIYTRIIDTYLNSLPPKKLDALLCHYTKLVYNGSVLENAAGQKGFITRNYRRDRIIQKHPDRATIIPTTGLTCTIAITAQPPKTRYAPKYHHKT